MLIVEVFMSDFACMSFLLLYAFGYPGFRPSVFSVFASLAAAFCITLLPLSPFPFCLLAAIGIADQRTGEIPFLFTFLFALYVICADRFYVIEALSVFAVLTGFSLAGKLGFGDVGLISLFVLQTGVYAAAATLSASLLCLAVNITKRGSDVPIPFGPYLCFGFLLTLWLFPL